MQGNNINRLGIYVYFDSNEKFKNYAFYYLIKLKEVCSEILVVVNGKLKETDKETLKKLDIGVWCRPNEGFDFGGWRDGLNFLGWEKVETFDEIVLCNSSCYGPITGTFKKMFEVMEKEECDFWGINRHPDLNSENIVSHIQSYFLVFRKKILNSSIFKNYWLKLPTFKTYNETVEKGEIPLTKYFEEKGFKSLTVVKIKDIQQDGNESLFFPIVLINNGSVLIKRKVFSIDFKTIFSFSNGSVSLDTLNFIKKISNYPIEYIYEDLNSLLPPSRITQNLCLIKYPDIEKYNSKTNKKIRIGIIFVAISEEMAELCLNFLYNLTKDSSFFIVSNKKNLIEFYQIKLLTKGFKNIEIKLVTNLEQIQSGYSLISKSFLDRIEIACLIHDMGKVSNSGIKEFYLIHHNFENLLGTAEYIEGVVNIFKNNSEIGLLVPPPPFFFSERNFFKNFWEKKSQKSAKTLLSMIPGEFVWDESPITSFDGMLWTRADVISSLLNLRNSLSSLTLEERDSLFNCIYKKLLPNFAQNKGFLTCKIMSTHYSKILINNLFFINTLIKKKNFNQLKIKYFKYLILEYLTTGRIREKMKIKKNKYLEQLFLINFHNN